MCTCIQDMAINVRTFLRIFVFWLLCFAKISLYWLLTHPLPCDVCGSAHKEAEPTKSYPADVEHIVDVTTGTQQQQSQGCVADLYCNKIHCFCNHLSAHSPRGYNNAVHPPPFIVRVQPYPKPVRFSRHYKYWCCILLLSIVDHSAHIEL